MVSTDELEVVVVSFDELVVVSSLDEEVVVSTDDDEDVLYPSAVMKRRPSARTVNKLAFISGSYLFTI